MSVRSSYRMRMQVRSLAFFSGLSIQTSCKLRHRLEMLLRFSVAMAVAQASSCSSDLTPNLETSICYRCSLKKKKKRKKNNKSNGKKVRKILWGRDIKQKTRGAKTSWGYTALRRRKMAGSWINGHARGPKTRFWMHTGSSWRLMIKNRYQEGLYPPKKGEKPQLKPVCEDLSTLALEEGKIYLSWEVIARSQHLWRFGTDVKLFVCSLKPEFNDCNKVYQTLQCPQMPDRSKANSFQKDASSIQTLNYPHK